MTSMDGKTPAEYAFERKDQVVTLGMKASVKIDGEQVQVDPQLLFQKLVAVAQTAKKLESAVKYELCSYSPALVDSSLQLREAHKSVFADVISDLLGTDVPADIPTDGKQYNWMVGHLLNAFHGLVDLHTETYATSTLIT